MVPNVKNGTSFVGAGLYYLHDKKQEGELVRLSDERVEWTHTLNCVSDNPELALREMSATARNRQFLKMLAGKGLGGERSDEVVKTISLAWDPEQTPDQATMIAASESYLKHMGWQDHQALLVAHNDTAHPHVHIVLNKVHPETGLILNEWEDQKRSQRWALQFEKEEGQVRCTVREAKYDRGEEAVTTGVPRDVWQSWKDRATSLEAMQAVQQRLNAAEWELLKEAQRDERDAFRQETKDQIRVARREIYDDVREKFRPLWKEFYALKENSTDRGTVEAARNTLLEARDAALAERQQEAIRGLQEGRQDGYQEMLARHREERGDLRDDQDASIRRYDLLHQWAPKLSVPMPPPTIDNASARSVIDVRENFARVGQEVTAPTGDEIRSFLPLIEEAAPRQASVDKGPTKDVMVGFAGGFLAFADAIADSISGSRPVPVDRFADLREQDDAYEAMLERNRQQSREEAAREEAERALARDREHERER